MAVLTATVDVTSDSIVGVLFHRSVPLVEENDHKWPSISMIEINVWLIRRAIHYNHQSQRSLAAREVILCRVDRSEGASERVRTARSELDHLRPIAGSEAIRPGSEAVLPLAARIARHWALH